MNREFKFRVWDSSLNKYSYFDLRDSYGRLPLDIPEENIQLFTGYLDKNEKEIYEGDLVKVDPNHSAVVLGYRIQENKGMYTAGEIKFMNAGFSICQEGIGRTIFEEYVDCDCCPCGLEIVGNIFEK